MKIFCLKKGWTIVVILALVLFYLICGAIAPFLRYQKVTEPVEIELEKKAAEENVDRAMLLETNTSAWEERIRLFSQAEERVILSTFDMRPGESTRDILAMLLHKAEEGVQVKILVDGFSGLIRMEGKPLFYAVSSHPNIEIKIYNPVNPLLPWKTQGRMHDKYVIVDDKAFILGGRNSFDYFIGDYNTKNKSFDREVLIYNTANGTEAGAQSSLYQVESYFEKVWNGGDCRLFHDKESLSERKKVAGERKLLKERYERIAAKKPELFEEPKYEKRTWPTEDVQLISGETGIYGKEPVVFEGLCQLMEQAKERVIIHTPYIVCNEDMYERLGEVAKKAPDIHIMINSVENGDNLVASSDYLQNKEKVVAVGIPLLEYDGGTSSHGKLIVIDDDISIIGSYNMDLRSTYMDTELMLAVRSEGLTKELAANMERMEKDCRRVVSATEYETPEHIQVQEIPLPKKMVFRLLGILLKPFRCVI